MRPHRRKNKQKGDKQVQNLSRKDELSAKTQNYHRDSKRRVTRQLQRETKWHKQNYIEAKQPQVDPKRTTKVRLETTAKTEERYKKKLEMMQL